MKTLYSDLRVELHKVAVQGSPHLEGAAAGTHSNHQRDKSLFIGLDVYGTTRVSGGVGRWQMSGFLPSVLILTDHDRVETRRTAFRLFLG